ncbi:MAG: allophanate hydrolase subunit 1 [Gammaproteobacteria bacterium]|jgi:KipI family sensor histidine kinase inhibitor|nr:allophanate hydrolase subunit 1 [Gammaproteobacteria bacterium]
MIYDEPRCAPGGDRFMLIEFGDELSLELNFFSQGLARAAEEQKIKGVVEMAPFFASLIVHYEPDDISFEDLQKELLALAKSFGRGGDVEVDSRLLYMPAVYLDPWTADAMREYREKINPDKQPDPEFIAQLNGLDDVAQFVRVHSGTEYWCAALGFWPGTPFLMPLDPRCRLTAPKYNPPRTFTPRGTIGMGGGASAIYPVDGPGGYQIFARTPVPIWDARQRLPQFESQRWLLQPTDRLKFVPCSVEEFDEIERKVDEGTYEMNITGYQRVSLNRYKAWAEQLDTTKRF